MSDVIPIPTTHAADEPTNPGVKRAEIPLAVLERISAVHGRLDRLRRDLEHELNAIRSDVRSHRQATAATFEDHENRLAAHDREIAEANRLSREALESSEASAREIAQEMQDVARQLHELIDRREHDIDRG